jgi:hypothetical protein
MDKGTGSGRKEERLEDRSLSIHHLSHGVCLLVPPTCSFLIGGSALLLIYLPVTLPIGIPVGISIQNTNSMGKYNYRSCPLVGTMGYRL